ncbi:alpha/beta hydrolase [Tistrella bauzanensis]|jgi:pimeloyl-ACP methyl ester carboxylesterase|uniref:Alpha/beta hydrolase n=1 Tax=Tistrella arctica TaxID=3133430 RepID=A0ABU9YFM0_9PROT
MLVEGVAVLGALGGGLALFTGWTAKRVEAAVPPRGRFMEIDGCRVHYLDDGAPGDTRPALVMVHGLGGQMHHFSHSLLARLRADYRVILIDRPGSGYSTRPDGTPAGLRAQAALIVAVIRALDLPHPPFLIGHSLGGAIALAVAIDHPDAVSGIGLIAALTHPETDPPAVFKGLAIRSDIARRLVAWTLATPMSFLRGQAVLAAVFGPDPVPADFATAGGGLLGLRPQAFRGASIDMVAVNDDLPAMVAGYGAITRPVHMIFARGDRILNWRTHAEALKQTLPALDLTLIEGGHMLPVTAPDAVAAWIRRAAPIG